MSIKGKVRKKYLAVKVKVLINECLYRSMELDRPMGSLWYVVGQG